jgi:Cu/Ag efflux protein CusF
MYPRKLNWFSFLALILIAGLFGGCDGENQSVSESMYPRVVQGEISSVKPDTRKLVLKPASSEQGENTTEQGEEVNQFKVAKDATITVLGKQAQLADLKEGQRVEVQYVVRDRMDEAGGVKVIEQPPVAKTAAGEIRAIRPASGTASAKIWLVPSPEGRGEGTTELGKDERYFKLVPDATITVLGKEANLSDLKEGQQAEVTYTAQDGTNRAGGVKVTEQPPVAKTAAGEISVVKPASGKAPARISLKPTSVQDKTTMSFRIIQNATITLNGQDADLAELRAGQQAEIQYFVDNGINKAHSVKISETAAVSDPAPG